MPKPYIPNDKWSQKAAAEGYRARSVYKLQELDEKFHLLKSGMKVLDLGAAPGSWLQYTARKIGKQGKAVGMDLTEIVPVADNVHVYTQDITDEEAVREILQKEDMEKPDIVLSDIAPNTSGVKDVDQWRSIELAQSVSAIAMKHLKPGGFCVIKVFRGADFDEFLRTMRLAWKHVKLAHVEASRDRSREIYVIMRK